MKKQILGVLASVMFLTMLSIVAATPMKYVQANLLNSGGEYRGDISGTSSMQVKWVPVSPFSTVTYKVYYWLDDVNAKAFGLAANTNYVLFSKTGTKIVCVANAKSNVNGIVYFSATGEKLFNDNKNNVFKVVKKANINCVTGQVNNVILTADHAI